MTLYNFKEKNIENVIHHLQTFTNTEFIIPTIIKGIVNDAYKISRQHENEQLHYPKVDEVEVYDKLENKYRGIIESSAYAIRLIEEATNMEKSEKEEKLGYNKSQIEVLNIILELTEVIAQTVTQALGTKENSQVFYRSIQVYPFIKYGLPNDEYEYSSLLF